MNDSIRWRFPNNDGGTIQGFNDSGIATFTGAALYNNLAREICQNSLDAKAADKGHVIVKFSLRSLSKEQFPALSDFDEIIKSCKDYWHTNDGSADTKFDAFIKDAEKTLSADKIKMLVISDYNTTGLPGAKNYTNKKTVWSALTQSSGVTNKTSGSSGGSYGIGKSAPFACSALRTVFYNTYAIDGVSAFQGVSRLVTHHDLETNCDTQGDGYYQNAKTRQPIFLDDKCPIRDEFARTEYGTDVIIAGFKAEENWQEIMEKAIISNFFVAIHEKTLIVEIGEHTINANTLPDMLAKYAEIEKADVSNPKDMQIIKDFYDTLTFPDQIHKTTMLENEDLWLYIKKDDSYSKTIMEMRSTGMKVRIRSKSIMTRFSAIVIARGNELNKLLKSIEPPKHDEWDAEIISDQPNYKLAKKIRSNLVSWTNKMILEDCKVDYQDDIDPAGISQFLPLELEDIKANNSAQESNNPDNETIIKAMHKRNLKMRSVVTPGVNNLGDASDGSGRNKTFGGNAHNPSGNTSSTGTEKVHVPNKKGGNIIESSPKVLYQRSFPVTPSYDIYKTVIELDEANEHVNISARAVGDDGKTEKLIIKEYTLNSIKTVVNDHVVGPLCMQSHVKYELYMKLDIKERMLINIVID